MSADEDSKLVRVKQAWARAGRLLTGRADPDHAMRLPPGQRLVTNWPVLDLGVQPDVPLADWRLTIDGAVTTPLVLDWDAFIALPQIDDTSDMHCVTQWSRFDNRWRGVATSTLLAAARPAPAANHVIMHSYDGYTTNVTLEAFTEGDCLIAHSWEGKPITREHGGPARAILPRWYLWKSAKWLNRIELVVADKPGFWETRGYHNEADPWLEQRYG